MIVRKKRTAGFSVIPNDVFTDERLSIGARWCLGYLLSKPNDWKVQPGDISRAGGVGREKGQQLVRELIDAGWIVREEVYEGNIRRGYHYVVLDEPVSRETEIPSPGRETGSRETEIPSLTKDGKIPSTELSEGNARARNGVSTSRGKRLPEDFQPSEASLEKASALGFDKGALEEELEKFRNYWHAKPGKDATKLDWQRTFQNWMITAAQRRPTHVRTQPQRPQRPDEAGGSQRQRNFDILDAIVAEAYRREDGGRGDGLQEDHGGPARLRAGRAA